MMAIYQWAVDITNIFLYKGLMKIVGSGFGNFLQILPVA